MTTTDQRPRQVDAAYRTYLAAAVLSLVGVVVSLTEIPGAAGASLAAAVGAVASGLTVWFAVRMRAGRNWGRIALIALTALHLVGLLGLVGGGVSPLSAVVLVAVAVVSTIGAVVSVTPPVSAWFAAARAPRPRTA